MILIRICVLRPSLCPYLFRPFKPHEKLRSGPETPPLNGNTGIAVVRPDTPPPQAVLQQDFVEHTNTMHRDQDFRFSQEYQVIPYLSIYTVCMVYIGLV